MTGRLPEGYRLVLLDEVGSTNAEALDRARAGEPSGLWVVGRRQVSGRGRQGRTWISERGNLYASLMLREDVPADRIGLLPLVVALGVHDAIADVLPPFARPGLRIKWPNDILLDGAKLCGILIEGMVQPAGRVLVIGMGINCRHHPDNPAYPASDLTSAGFPTEPEDLFPLLAARLAARLDLWRGGAIAMLREAWLARARGLGEPITVRLPAGTLDGIFDGLDADGRLRLRTATGMETISAGDVFFGRP